jgi:hypothetical protein
VLLWTVFAKYRKWPFSAPRRTKTPQPIKSFLGQNVHTSAWMMQLISWKVSRRSYAVSTAKCRSWSVCFSSRLLHQLTQNAVSALFVGWKLATQHDDPTTSKFSGSQPYSPWSPGLSWCRCTDRGICFDECKTCVNVSEMTAHIRLSPVVVSTLIDVSLFDYLMCLTALAPKPEGWRDRSITFIPVLLVFCFW